MYFAYICAVHFFFFIITEKPKLDCLFCCLHLRGGGWLTLAFCFSNVFSKKKPSLSDIDIFVCVFNLNVNCNFYLYIKRQKKIVVYCFNTFRQNKSICKIEEFPARCVLQQKFGYVQTQGFCFF